MTGWLSRFLRLTHVEEADLFQFIHLEIAKAYSKHDPARGTFVGLGYGAIKLAIKRFIRTRIQELRVRAATRSVSELSTNESWCLDRRVFTTGEVDDRLDLKDAINRLPPKLAELVWARTRHSASEIAHRHGLHRGTVQRKLDRAYRLLKEILKL